MRKKVELIMVLVLLVAVIAASKNLSEYVTSESVKNTDHDKIVILDAGHGGADPGKIGVNDALEKDVNLKITKKIKKLLEKDGFTVVMTRKNDEGLYSKDASNKKVDDMKKRVALINKTKPPLVVSIHQNSYHEEGIKGAQVFYYAHSKDGEKMAAIMQKKLKSVDSDNNREAKANNTYYMLKRTEVPTIIVECGFLSNWEEAKLLVSDEYQDKLAKAICEGIQECIGK